MTKSMKSLIVEKDGTLVVKEVPVPVPTPVQALVKIEACGICNGTDTKLIHRAFKGIGKEQYPLMLGHEAVGTVVEIGDKVKSYRKGDRVLLPYAGPLGGYGSGWGAFSEYGTVDDVVALQESGVLPDSADFPPNCYAQNVIDKKIPVNHAVVIITLREVLASIRFFGIEHDQSVAVFGCGPVGQTFIKFMHLLGVGPIFAIDIIDEKLKMAKTCGADYVFNNTDGTLDAMIHEVCPKGVDYVIDASGASAVINQAMGIIKDRGKICCYGISENLDMNLDWSRADYNWQLIFQQMPRKVEEQQAFSQILVWIEKGVVDPEEFISDVYDFDHVLEAFKKLERKEISRKCVVTFD
ncbi:zinc-dependent alcohol dehydrogenase [Christensenella tenuis]|nr:zinc-binding dehydrogenase [Christensenella tenuis]